MSDQEAEYSSTNQNNLIVNYLPSTVTECELAQLFGSIGEIQKTKVVRDRATGISLGFGFVEYVNASDAARAVDAFDGLSLQSKRLKVAYARPTSGVEGANVHVRNLEKTVSAKDVEMQFGVYGEIVRARVLNDPQTGLSRGIAFVLFAHKEHAERAVADLHGATLPGFANQPLCVRFAVDNSTKARMLAASGAVMPTIALPTPNPCLAPVVPPPGYGFGTGYGAGLGGGPVRGAAVRQRFNPLGMMSQPSAMRPPISTRLPNVGLAGQSAYANAGVQAAVFRARASAIMPHFEVAPPVVPPPVNFPLPADYIPGGHVVFVYNLEPDAKDSDLWQLFGPFGAVKKVNVIYENDKSKCKGYGFVTMVNFDEAMAAISFLNGYVYKDRVLQVSLKKQGHK